MKRLEIEDGSEVPVPPDNENEGRGTGSSQLQIPPSRPNPSDVLAETLKEMNAMRQQRDWLEERDRQRSEIFLLQNLIHENLALNTWRQKTRNLKTESTALADNVMNSSRRRWVLTGPQPNRDSEL